MGAVFRPKDLGRGGYRNVIERSVRDLRSDTRENVIRLLNSWEGTRSEERLKDRLGHVKAQEILKGINAKKEEQYNLRI
ncbi:MAG TPA: hypothetical protein VE378_06515 [Nitrososphaeraceae archaeon]|jgi:hypothetical protein|nr:hypothetical protein [Nitrososphaeraceae archaeon]